MVPLYFALIKCLHFGMPYLKSNSSKGQQVRRDQNGNSTEHSEDI